MNKDLLMYGMDREDIKQHYMNGLTARMVGLEMVVAGILSDSQHLMEMGNNEDARKQLNVAKFILFEMLEAREAKENA